MKLDTKLNRSGTLTALLSLGISAVCAVPSSAAPTGTLSAPAAASRPPALTPEPTYTLDAGDVIGVTVVNFPNLTVPQTTVAPDGTVSLPLIGQVAVAGKTAESTAALLSKKWNHFVVDPAVTVSLVQKHLQTIVFSGSVNKAGPIDYRPGIRLLEALAEAGGPTLTGADLASSVVTHADGSKQALDLTHPETKTDTDANIVLQPGDVIYVPEQLGKISVVGEVKTPGSYIYRENLTVLDVINASGGYNPDTADLQSAKLTHNGKDRSVDLDALLRQGQMTANVNVYPGDRLVIPELHNRTYVFGAVEHQGYYYYKPGDRIQDALNSAGVLPDADFNKINVIHVDKTKQLAQLIKVNFNDFVLRGNIAGNPQVQPGDSLYLSKKHEQFNADTALRVLGGVGSAASTARYLNGR